MSKNEVAELPPPNPAEVAQSQRLQETLAVEMEQCGGSIDFGRFMELALYAPGLGYYVGGASKLGRQGDFVTAPEISDLFSRCVARQVEQVLSSIGRGLVLEFGAGSGRMAASILSELDIHGQPPEEYWILEVSPDLRRNQRETLELALPPHLVERIRWLERIPAAPFEGVVLANEVLDAMPVRRFRMTAEGPRPLHVRQNQGTLEWCLGAEDSTLSRTLLELQDSIGRPLPEGYESEFNPSLAPWVQTVADCLTAGLLLIVDYGYPRDEFYHPQRHSGTLVCHYRHRAHFDPLWLPGLQDITASVDFSAVAEAALDAGLNVAGFASQAWFLLSSGLHEILTAEDQEDTARYLELARQAKILTMPGEMGERFKALALIRGLGEDLVGFAQQDWRQKL